ncbi:unnamed protein product [Wickerhamomyces anomalus]
MKPSCSSCINKCISCVWPKDGGDKLPKGYSVPSSRSSEVSPNEGTIFVPVEFVSNTLDVEEKSPVSSIDFFESPKGMSMVPYSNAAELIDDFGSPDSTSYSLDLENSSAPLYKISFLSPFSSDPDQRFILASFNALETYVNNNESAYKESWVGAAFQLMCLCSKITWSCSSDNCIANLVNSYKIIRRRFIETTRYGKKIQKSDKISSLEPQSDLAHYLKDFKNDALQMDIENSLIDLDDFSTEVFESHFEKMFVESFLFNYSIALLVSEQFYLLPNPFEVFRDLRQFLKTPLFSCDVAWMNNPVFGASLDAYELAAKASYLLRNLNDPNMLVTAKKLYDLASFYPSPMIPSEIRVNSTKYKNLRDSVLMAEIVAKVSKILLRKLIIPEITEMDSVVQKDLSSIFIKLKSISSDSRVKIISCWPLLIAGAATQNEEQRELLTKTLLEAGALTHGRHVYTVLDALDIAWGKSPECEEIKTRGLDILFDRRVVGKVIL